MQHRAQIRGGIFEAASVRWTPLSRSVRRIGPYYYRAIGDLGSPRLAVEFDKKYARIDKHSPLAEPELPVQSLSKEAP